MTARGGPWIGSRAPRGSTWRRSWPPPSPRRPIRSMLTSRWIPAPAGGCRSSWCWRSCSWPATPRPSRQSAWSPSSTATLAAVVMLGPIGAALVGVTSLLSVRRGVNLAQRAFNAAMYTLSAFAAGGAYLALGGTRGVPHKSSFPGIIAPFAAAAAVHVIVNHGLLSGMLLLLPPPEAARRARLDVHLPMLLPAA